MIQNKGKVILVAGGSGLLGKAILMEALGEHNIVINADMVESGINDVIEIKTDLTSRDQVDYLVSKIKKTHSSVDGFINCSYPRSKRWGHDDFENLSYDEWSRNIDLHLNSYFYLSQQILGLMKEGGKGSVLNFGSIYGVVGNDLELYKGLDIHPPAAYSAIKGGIVNFTRFLASHYGKYNINVNCLSPGGIFDDQNQEFVARYCERVPMKRMGSPDDIAPVACFLISDKAKYITGQNIIVDGGWTCI